MSSSIKLALIICFFTCIIVCDAEAKAKKSRTRNNRRCPHACLRRIKQLEKKTGIPGPPGPQGPEGNPGPKGDELELPVCKRGEYLTSDGKKLTCVKLDLDEVCSAMKRCPINDKDPSKGNEGTSTVTGKMVKFMKKNMFQSISTDAWDIEVFNIGGTLFFGLSQLGHASFQIYKWYTDSFKDFQNFKVNGARNWAPFKIGNDQYFVIGSYVGDTCPIYRYDRVEDKFKKQTDGLECKETVDVKPFKINGEQYVIVANHEDNEPVVVWKWNEKQFNKNQEIDITATYVEAFEVDSETFIAISGSESKGPYVFLYKWSGKEFTFFQRLFTVNRPYEMAAFEAGQDKFLSVATMGTKTSSSKLQIMKWNGNEFESFQNITSYGARRLTAMSTPLMGKETTYLAVINHFNKPEIYYWVEGRTTKFEKLQEIEAKTARDICFFEMGKNLYLLISSRNHIDIFRGELV